MNSRIKGDDLYQIQNISYSYEEIYSPPSNFRV